MYGDTLKSYFSGVRLMNSVIKRRPLIILLSSIMLILTALTGLVLAMTPRENIISPGVSVNGQYVGRLTGLEASELLRRRFNENSKTGNIQLLNGREKWVIPYDDLGIRYNFSAAAEDALRIGKKGSAIQKVIGMVKIYFTRPDLALSYEVDNDKLEQTLVAIGSQIDIAAQDASICIYYGRIKILPAVTGRTLNINSTRKKIENALSRLDSNPIILDVETHVPELTSDQLKNINGSLGIGMTDVSTASRLRFETLKSAVTLLNGIFIEPGKEFSFNSTVGHKLRELIYHYGTVVQKNGKPVLANSGGASQAASTLYQAVLQSELRVTERFTHKVSPVYVPPEQDAAVAMGKLDFKFENSTKNPIYIMAEIKDDKMIVKLMGVRKDNQTL